jgi:hypothetical protein
MRIGREAWDLAQTKIIKVVSSVGLMFRVYANYTDN